LWLKSSLHSMFLPVPLKKYIFCQYDIGLICSQNLVSVKNRNENTAGFMQEF